MKTKTKQNKTKKKILFEVKQILNYWNLTQNITAILELIFIH